MKARSLIILLCVVFGMSCSEEGKSLENIIDLETAMENIQPLNVVDVAESVRYVPLETTDSSLVGNRPYVCKLRDKLIVTSEKCPVLMFDAQTGKFIRQVGAFGQGPGEYAPLNDTRPSFWCDETQGRVLIKSGTGQVLQYDSDGNYIGLWKMSEEVKFPASYSQVAAKGKVIFYEDRALSGQRYGLMQVDAHSGEMEMQMTGSPERQDVEFRSIVFFGRELGIPASPNCYLYLMKDNGVHFNYQEDPRLWNHEDEVYFKERFNDTIYHLKDKALQPRYVLHLGERHWPMEQRFNGTETRFKVSIDYILESERKLCIMFKTDGYNLEYKKHCAVYDKEDGTVKVSDEPLLHDIARSCVVESLHSSTPDGTIVGLTSIEKYLELGGPGYESMKEDDNPIVVLLK